MRDNGTLNVCDQQNQEVDSSEQYAINALEKRAIKAADRAVKEGKQLIERSKSPIKPRRNRRANIHQGTVPRQENMPTTGGALHTQTETIQTEPKIMENVPAAIYQEQRKVVTNTPRSHVSTQNRSKNHISTADFLQAESPASHGEFTQQPIQFETADDPPTLPQLVPSDPASAKTLIFTCKPQSERSQPHRSKNPRKSAATYQEKINHSPSSHTPASHMHTKPIESGLHTGREVQLDTWANNPMTSSLQNQGTALAVVNTSETARQSFQAVGQTAGQSVGSAGASAAAYAAAPGVATAVQATEKVVTKAKEAIESIAASAPRNSSTVGALAALFLMPLLFLMAIAGALRSGGSARNVGLSDEVLALMPQIAAACQANGIPEYAPLVAAVIMQESGGRVADVGGDVMQCAEGMGLPVGTPVDAVESINFGTNIIAENLRLACTAGPTDIPAISLALQGYNFGNGYISWAQARGGYSKENAREFSEMQATSLGWGGYGDVDYVDHVLRYYQVSVGSMGDVSAIADGRFAFPFPGHTWNTYPSHNGIDIAFANIYGEPVYAVADGTVRYTQDGWVPAYGVGGMWSFGNAVFLEHGDGWTSAYGHLSALAVSRDEYVTQGQLVGYVGSTGNSTGPHLHLALYHNGEAGIGSQNFAELAWPQYRG